MSLSESELISKYNALKIAMTGHVQCKVFGLIKMGDRITLSNIPGVGKVATTFEEKTFSFGIARESYNSEEIGLIEIRLF